MRRIASILGIVYFLAAGFLLVVAPWTDRWSVNRFYGLHPDLRGFFTATNTRTGVTVLGAILLSTGLMDGLRLLADSRRQAGTRGGDGRGPGDDPGALSSGVRT